MGRKCTVCAHPDIADINLAIAAAEKQATIAKRYSLTTNNISRHKRNNHIDIGPASKPAKKPVIVDKIPDEIETTREKALAKDAPPPDESRHLTNVKCHNKLGNYIAALETLVAKYLKSDNIAENLVCIRAIRVASQVINSIMASNYKNLEDGLLHIDAMPVSLLRRQMNSG